MLKIGCVALLGKSGNLHHWLCSTETINTKITHIVGSNI